MGKVRQWLLDYLKRYDDELKRFPNLLHEPHFDLLMADYDRNREGLFVVAVFQSNEVSFLVGRGDSLKVREFAESTFPDNVLNVFPELSKQFHVFSQPLSVIRSNFDSWIKG